jgi:hypothetical protein
MKYKTHQRAAAHILKEGKLLLHARGIILIASKAKQGRPAASLELQFNYTPDSLLSL